MSVVEATFAATLVDEWARAGVTQAVVCPGSRSAPLSQALWAHPSFTVHPRLDERGAGFFALGLAAAAGAPVVVCVTSGTAGAELHAAVVEAHHGCVPLVVCTADRPPELHGVGAPQTIEQSSLYAGALRWSASPGVAREAAAWSWRSLGARAVAEAVRGPFGPGPVHLNLAFSEPLVTAPGALPEGRAGREPAHLVVERTRVERVGEWPGARGVVVVGARCGPPEAVLALAEHLGWPVLADPRSGCRVRDPHVVAAADAIARSTRDDLRPDGVICLGEPWASKAVARLVSGARVVAVDPWWRWQDPDRRVGVVERASPDAWIEAALRREPPPTPKGWLSSWQEAERVAEGAMAEALGSEVLTEPLVARTTWACLPSEATVVASSSMPVRDLEWFAPARPTPPRVLSNRGANGIDGVSSTALGVAAWGGGPVVGILGDLAFFHDVSALVSPVAAPPGAPCALVVVDNGGGGIFEHLPQGKDPDRERFERLFAAPQTCDVVEVAAGFGVGTADVGTPGELTRALHAALGTQGITVVRARVPRRPGNLAVHARVEAAVSAALG